MLALNFKHNYQPCQRSNSISKFLNKTPLPLVLFIKRGRRDGKEGRERGEVKGKGGGGMGGREGGKNGGRVEGWIKG